jgi:glycerophosphoryl diester phosphodiesterase
MSVNLFAHRGFWHEYSQQNSIASLKNAHENNFYGVEFDVWFCEKRGLLLSHDEVAQDEILPNFCNYLQFGNNFKYWIDFKNLDLQNAKKVFEIVKKDVEAAKIDFKNIFIAPFITRQKLIFDIYQIAQEVFKEKLNFAATIEYEEEKAEIIDFICQENIKFLSISHKLIDETIIKKLANISFFAWTVNDLARIIYLEKLGIKNFITDKITPQIYDTNAAESGS